MPGAATSARYSAVARVYLHNPAPRRRVPATLRKSTPVKAPPAPKPKLSRHERLKALPRCSRKKGFASWATAEEYARDVFEKLRPAKRKTPVLTFAYRCGDCQQWHTKLGRRGPMTPDPLQRIRDKEME